MEYIISFNNSIPEKLCDNIIKMFESQEDKHVGRTRGGVITDVKNTTDFCIPQNDIKWNKINMFLSKELSSKIIKYKRKIAEYVNILPADNYGKQYTDVTDDLSVLTFMIQKYNIKCGKYVYHNDFELRLTPAPFYRVLTFIWYLNTIEEGGETIFWNNYKIKPKKGTLVLFPATWTYPHTGKMPISDNKYIITGWLYTEF